jgi:hypothetical protein
MRLYSSFFNVSIRLKIKSMTFTKKLNVNRVSPIWQRLKQNSTLLCANEHFQFEKKNHVWLKNTKKFHQNIMFWISTISLT